MIGQSPEVLAEDAGAERCEERGCVAAEKQSDVPTVRRVHRPDFGKGVFKNLLKILLDEASLPALPLRDLKIRSARSRNPRAGDLHRAKDRIDETRKREIERASTHPGT